MEQWQRGGQIMFLLPFPTNCLDLYSFAFTCLLTS